MEDSNKITSSCIMLACDLQTPVSLSSIFEPGDLKDTGIEYDSHVTILYARKDIKTSGIWEAMEGSPSILELLERERDKEEFTRPVMELFDLGSFENDSGYVVLKLKDGNEWYDVLGNLNKKLQDIYDVTSDFGSYTPHLTLAELEPGLTDKYLQSETLGLVLQNSTVHFEDIILSHTIEGEEGYKVQNITSRFAVDRFFRIRELIREGERI